VVLQLGAKAAAAKALIQRLKTLRANYLNENSSRGCC